MTTNTKLKEVFEVESKYGAFFTGGNIEFLTNKSLICQKETHLQILDIETGTVSLTIGEEDSDDLIHTFTSDDTSIITAHKSGLLKQWEHSGGLIKAWKSIHKGQVSKMCLNDWLATGGTDGNVRLWDLKHQSCRFNLRGSEGVISVVVFHPDGHSLFASGDDAKINSWDIRTGNIKNVYNGHFSKITSIVFAHDKKHMISTGRDKVIIMWDTVTGATICTIPVFESLESVVCLPQKFDLPGVNCRDGIFVGTAGEKGVIKIWNLDSAKLIYEQTNSITSPAKEDSSLSITSLLFNANILNFVVVTVEHNVIMYELNTFECIKQFVGFSDEILDACFVGNDNFLAVATNSADIKLYETSTMSCQLLRGHTDIVLGLAKTNSDPNVLLSSSKDNSIRLWRLENCRMTCVGIGSKHTGSVGSVALSHNSNFAVSVSQDTCVKIWEIPKVSTNNMLECTKTEIAHQKDINCVAVSPNDKIIATGSQDKLTKLWTENLELIGVLRGHKRGIWCAKFSPVDQIIMTSSADCTVKVWSVVDLNCLKTLQGHDSSVLKTEFLSNGMQILTSGADGFLKLFNLKSSECILTLDKHEARVWALAVKSDESIIVSGGSDSLLIKWKDVTAEKKLEKIREIEELTAQEQELSNLVQNNQLLKALKLSLRLDRPLQTLKIIRGIIKVGGIGLAESINQLNETQKDSLLKCAIAWNTNSKNCQPAQLVLNILINEFQGGKFKPVGLSNVIESTLPYTERHYRRITQLLQDLYIINYTVNCMQPHAKMTE